MILTTPGSVDVTIGTGGTELVDFGVAPLGDISGVLWVDTDGDGVVDAGETRLEGVRIDVYDEDGNLVTSVTTDADGSYSIADLPPGTYTVVVDEDTLPDGVVPAPGTELSITVTLSGDDLSVSADFAFQEVAGLPFTGWDLLRTVAAALVLLLGGAGLAPRRATTPPSRARLSSWEHHWKGRFGVTRTPAAR